MLIETSESFKELELWLSSEEQLHSKLGKMLLVERIKVKSSYIVLKTRK